MINNTGEADSVYQERVLQILEFYAFSICLAKGMRFSPIEFHVGGVTNWYCKQYWDVIWSM